MMIKLLLAAGLAFAATSVHAQSAARDDRPSWYLGAGIGYTSIDQSISDTSLAVPGDLSSSLSIKDTATSGRVFGGFKVNRHFAIEAGYLYANDFDVRRTVFAPDTVAGTYDVKWKLTGAHLDALAILPMTDSLKLMGKLGVMRATSTVKGNLAGFQTDQTSSKWALRYGAALQIDFNDFVAFRADADVIPKATNSNVLSIGSEELTYKSFTANLLFKF